jgi:hypothetical protein
MKNYKNGYSEKIKNLILYQHSLICKLIGQKIIDVYYRDIMDGWDFEITDPDVRHVPEGILFLITNNIQFYKIDTSYQSWSGGEFGLVIKDSNQEDLNQMGYSSCLKTTDTNIFSNVIGTEILEIRWHWKLEQIEPLKSININILCTNITDKDYYPDNLEIAFKNGNRIYIFAAEPDNYLEESNTYTLIGAGEELMIFRTWKKAEEWGIKTKGFKIELE